MHDHDIVLESAAVDFREPLHAKVRQALRRLILTNFQDGQRFYSERELLLKLKVSQPTVRRALSDLADEGFLAASARRGFFVRKQGTVRSVGVFIIEWEDTFAPAHRSLAAISAACRSLDYPLHVYYTHKEDTVPGMLAKLRGTPVEERIILCEPALPRLFQLHSALEKAGYWTVAMDGAPDNGYTGSCVDIDYGPEVEIMVDHLMDLGHRRIDVLLNEPENLGNAHARLLAIKELIAARELREMRIVSCGTKLWDNSFDAAYGKMENLLTGASPPTAIVPISAVGAWAALKYLLRHRVKVPDDVSVFSFGDLPGSALLPVPLTAVDVSLEREAQCALDLLWGERQARVARLKPRLILRESTGPYPETNPRGKK